jgi:hypothetical protein
MNATCDLLVSPVALETDKHFKLAERGIPASGDD